MSEPVWLEPYPDTNLGLEGPAGPDARYEQREAAELAFIAALQHLPARQRAVLIVDAVVAMPAEDARMAMPPLPSWYGGRDQVAAFFVDMRSPTANAGGCFRHRRTDSPHWWGYLWEAQTEAFLPYCLYVLTLRRRRIQRSRRLSPWRRSGVSVWPSQSRAEGTATAFLAWDERNSGQVPTRRRSR